MRFLMWRRDVTTATRQVAVLLMRFLLLPLPRKHCYKCCRSPYEIPIQHPRHCYCRPPTLPFSLWDSGILAIGVVCVVFVAVLLMRFAKGIQVYGPGGVSCRSPYEIRGHTMWGRERKQPFTSCRSPYEIPRSWLIARCRFYALPFSLWDSGKSQDWVLRRKD